MPRRTSPQRLREPPPPGVQGRPRRAGRRVPAIGSSSTFGAPARSRGYRAPQLLGVGLPAKRSPTPIEGGRCRATIRGRLTGSAGPRQRLPAQGSEHRILRWRRFQRSHDRTAPFGWDEERATVSSRHPAGARDRVCFGNDPRGRASSPEGSRCRPAPGTSLPAAARHRVCCGNGPRDRANGRARTRRPQARSEPRHPDRPSPAEPVPGSALAPRERRMQRREQRRGAWCSTSRCAEHEADNRVAWQLPCIILGLTSIHRNRRHLSLEWIEHIKG